MATPVLADLRAHWKDAAITAMCQSNVAPILKEDPNINELFAFKRPSGWIHRSQHLEIIDNIRKGEYDLGILLTNSFSSAWWFWRGRVKNRIGYKGNLRSLLLNQALSYDPQMKEEHLVVTYKRLLAPMGISLSDTAPKLYLSQEEKDNAQHFLKLLQIDPEKNIIVGINPGAAYGSAKCWLPERYRAVTEKLLENPKVSVLYFGDTAGASLVHDICSHLPSERVINLAGKTTLRELMALIQCCAIFLTNDSGPMHIAAALGRPLLALFGSTSDVQTGPYHTGKVIHKHVECSPCYKRICPIDFRCMKRIEVDEVYRELQKMIQNL